MLATASKYLGANILNAAVPFLLLPILTRVLTPGEYGTVAMFEATAACLGVFTGLSVHGAVGVRYYREDDKAHFPQYVGVCLLILAGSTLVTAGVIAVGGRLAVRTTGLSLGWVLLAVAVSSAQFVINIRLAIWQMGNQPVRYGAFQFSQTAFNALISLGLVLYLAWGAAGRMIGFASAAIVFGALALMTLQSGGWIKWQWDRGYFLDAIRFGLPLIPHTLGIFAVAFADRFIITTKLGVDSTGLYFVSVQFSMVLLVLGTSFNRAFVPWLFERLSRGENIKAVTASYIAIGGLLLIGLLYGLIVYYGLSFVVGQRYQAARTIAPILIIGTSFQAAYYAVVNYLFYAMKTNYLSVITIITGGIYVSGAWLIVPRYGLTGIALLFAAMQCLTFFFVWFASAKVSPQPWLDLVSIRRSVRDFANEMT